VSGRRRHPLSAPYAMWCSFIRRGMHI
jgi:hypothetical protein